jgi:hypothetical protein
VEGTGFSVEGTGSSVEGTGCTLFGPVTRPRLRLIHLWRVTAHVCL